MNFRDRYVVDVKESQNLGRRFEHRMGQHDGSFPSKGNSLDCKSFSLPFLFLNPVGICPRSLANITTSKNCLTKRPLES